MAKKTREETIIEMIEAIMEAIINDISEADDLLEDAKKAGLLESILSRLDDLGIRLEDVVPVGLAEEYFKGMTFGESALIAAGIGQAALISTTVKSRVHVEALEALVSDGMGDLKAAINTIKENAPGKLDEILNDVQKTLGQGILTGDTRKAITAQVSDRFLKEGLTAFKVTDKKGNVRNLPLDFYAKTVVKTKLRQAHNTGTENRYKDNKVDLVIVDEHYPTCKECAKRQGVIISLSGNASGYQSKDEIGLPPWHPNCRHTFRPYIPAGKTEEELKKDKAKKFKPNKDPRTDAQKKAYEKEQEIRRLANREKKDYEKLKAVLGADNVPKTLGAFRRMRRKNDLTWKTLQKQYREALKGVDDEGA